MYTFIKPSETVIHRRNYFRRVLEPPRLQKRKIAPEPEHSLRKPGLALTQDELNFLGNVD
jgi:hypothetical protein